MRCESEEAKGRIFEIKRFAVHDGPGVRTTVFFKGCPLSCIWCHNPEGIDFGLEIAYIARRCAACGACVSFCPQKLHAVQEGVHHFFRKGCAMCFACIEACMPGALKLYGKEVTADELLDIVLPDWDFYSESGGGITCSGGEPLAQAEFLVGFLKRCKRAGLHTAVDTSGYAAWEDFEKIIPYTDLFLYDLKHMNSQKHTVLTKVPNAVILDNLRRLSGSGCSIELRMPVVPGMNDDEENLYEMVNFLSDIRCPARIRPLPYHALSGSKYMSLGKEHAMPTAVGTERERAVYVARFFAAAGFPTIEP